MKTTGTSSDKRKNKRILIISAVLFTAALILSVASRKIPGAADWYTAYIYPVWVGTLGRLSGIFPFSAAEMICLALPLLLIADIVINLRMPISILMHILLITALLFFLYEANCGVNYYSRPFTDPAAVREAEFSEDELAGFCEYISQELSRNYVSEYPGRSETARIARESMIRLSSSYPELAGFYPRPKQLAFISRLFSSMGVSGIYSPFTIESNINGEMPDMEKPFTSCHELSHLRGFMNEGEANYIGWLACIGSEDTAFRRSGWLIAWSYAGNALKRTSRSRYNTIYRTLPDDAVRELTHNYIFWTTLETKASDVQDRINDAYLKSNGLESGIASYGQLTDLMLLWFRENDQ